MTFEDFVKEYGVRMQSDLSINAQDAAAICGNIGHETGGLKYNQEIAPKSGRGGLGLVQWTGPRRVAFEAFAKKADKPVTDIDTQYQYLLVELRGDYKKALTAIRRQRTLYAKVVAFEEAYEKAGVKAYKDRAAWASKAVALL